MKGLFRAFMDVASQRGRDKSFDFHQMNGAFRVQYSDGQISQPFTYDTAKDYAAMFGGKVIPK